MGKRGRILIGVAGALAVVLAAASAGATEKERKPYTKYWMSVATQNMTMPGMPEDTSLLGGMLGGYGGGRQRSLLLQLTVPRPLPPSPEATHDIPPGQRMGETLPLLIPGESAPKRSETPERPTQFEKPKARIVMYWGCGPEVRSGQPRILDTEKMSPAEFGKAFAGRAASPQYPPAPRQGWIYAEWPNEQRRVEAPKDSSLKGEHRVHGSYPPDIRFTLDEKRDFMAPVEFSSVAGGRAESIRFEWKPVPTAIGYFALATAADDRSGEMIIWTSSELPEAGFGLLDYLPSSDVRRFIKEKVVLGPEVKSCAIPKGIFKKSGSAMLQFIAYGEELDVVFPPKPKDPKQPWEPLWAVKVRLKSTGMTPLGEGGLQAEGREPKEQRDAEGRQEPESAPSKKSLDKLRNIFGF